MLDVLLKSLPLGKKNRIWEYRRNQKSYFSRSSPLFITRMFSRTKQWNRTFFCFNNSEMSKHEYSMRITWSSDRSISICECALAFFFLSFITSYSWFWFHLIYSHSNYSGIVSWPYNVLIWFWFSFKLPIFWCATRQNLFNHKLDVNHEIWYISRDIGNFKLS